jgi:hypothetical protein
LESGFDQHFTKPLTVDQLEDILDRLVAPNTDY